MNNTANCSIITYHTLDYWYNFYGFAFRREIIYLVFIPLNIVGFTFNIISHVVYKGEDFHIPVYNYFRVYTINSALICLLLTTRFVNTSKRFFSFSNSIGANIYYAEFYLPILNSLTLFQASLDIILAFDRIVLFSNKYLWFKRLNPIKVSRFCLVISFISMLYHWIRLVHVKTDIYLSETSIYTMHYLNLSHFSNVYATYATHFISDVIPLCIEIPLNLVTIKLVRSYIIKKKSVGVLSTTQPSQRGGRAKVMEFKVTFLVVFMSFLSIM
jgi:hypothetical protein